MWDGERLRRCVSIGRTIAKGLGSVSPGLRRRADEAPPQEVTRSVLGPGRLDNRSGAFECGDPFDRNAPVV